MCCAGVFLGCLDMLECCPDAIEWLIDSTQGRRVQTPVVIIERPRVDGSNVERGRSKYYKSHPMAPGLVHSTGMNGLQLMACMWLREIMLIDGCLSIAGGASQAVRMLSRVHSTPKDSYHRRSNALYANSSCSGLQRNWRM